MPELSLLRFFLQNKVQVFWKSGIISTKTTTYWIFHWIRSAQITLLTTGDIYVSDYEGDEAGTVVERYNKGNDAISSLKNGKIDCVVIDEQPAKEYVKRNSDLSILDEEFTLEEYAIVIAKGNDSLEEDINKALAEMMADGTLDMIINQ